MAFDPSTVVRPGLATRVQEFENALLDVRWVADRVMAGQQFNAYESAENDEEDDPHDWEYALCIGPITDHRFICPIVGRERAQIVEAAMKVATEAMLSRRTRDSGSGSQSEDPRSGAEAEGPQSGDAEGSASPKSDSQN